MIYLDTSLMLPLFIREPASDDVRRWFAALPPGGLTISEWTRTEFVSAIGIKVGSGRAEKQVAREIVRTFHQFVRDSLVVLLPDSEDFLLSRHYLERFELGLRAGDALHLAMAFHHGADKVYSLDRVIIKSAHRLNIKAEMPI